MMLVKCCGSETRLVTCSGFAKLLLFH
uniref:Uncharacterized protein n=1 Tax=Anopheles dirus TaxID=7168 RepID=A0A182NWG4_9DIPT